MTGHILIVGGGPAGLALARALAGSSCRVTLIERQPEAALAAPVPDGREIALTHRSGRLLRELGAWQHLPGGKVYPLREARILNGGSLFALEIAPGSKAEAALGMLVSNHLIRRALFASVKDQSNLTIRAGVAVERVAASAAGATVRLADGSSLSGELLVAADARLSATRAQLGIPAKVEPLGKTMLVCRVTHELSHCGVATEWFDNHRTVAMLPLAEHHSSLVLTLPNSQAQAISELAATALGPLFTQFTAGRWGEIHTQQSPFAYPLTMTYASRFSGPRAALIGDAAVGMHPVTAHGLNFGLLSAVRLAKLIGHAADPGDPHLLTRYAVAHRAATWPLYQATRQLVRLFTNERPLARLARHAALRFGGLPPVRGSIGRLLMHNTPAGAS